MATTESRPPEFERDTKGILAEISELYYKEGLTQSQIAKRKGVSRATIVSYLKQARDSGIVEIHINGSAYTGSNLSHELREKYNLADVYIARTSGNENQDENLRKIGRLGAVALADLLETHEVLGVSWGDTIQRAAEEMPWRHIEDLTVCQLVGSMPSNAMQAAEALTIIISTRTGGRCFDLPTPAILSSAALAKQLRSEPIVKQQLSQFKKLTTVFFSVGHAGPDSLVVASGVATLKDWAYFNDKGSVAVLSGHFLDANGKVIKSEYHERLIGIHPYELRKVPRRILVAGGEHKYDAVCAALAGGYATHLVTDDSLARLL